jgi:succinylglutamate desuccinylase
MSHKILFSCCTHGDEHIGQEIFRNYPYGSNQYFEWKSILSNPEANYINQRFVDQDLNRSFPGKKDGNYEQNRAFQITQILPNFDFVIDFHQTTSKMDDIIFINSSNPEVLQICQSFEAEHIIILNNSFGGENKLLIDVCQRGIAIEYSRSGDFKEECSRIINDVENILNQKKSKVAKKIYSLIGKVPISKSQSLNWKNFKEIQVSELEKLNLDFNHHDKPIFPIFISEKAYPETYCSLVILV